MSIYLPKKCISQRGNEKNWPNSPLPTKQNRPEIGRNKAFKLSEILIHLKGSAIKIFKISLNSKYADVE